MSRGGLVLLSLLPWWLVACGDGEDGESPFEELCEADEPVELLALEDDEAVGWVDRVGEGDDIHVVVNAAGDPSTRRRSVVVDECARWVTPLDPRIGFLTHWGHEIIGCAGADLVRLWDYTSDPMILVTGGCARATQVGDRWVTIGVRDPESGVGRLTTLAFAEVDHYEQPLFSVSSSLSDVLVGEGHPSPEVADGRVFVQTADLAIYAVELDPLAFAIEVEQAEPGAWRAHGSWLAYRPPVLDSDAPSPVVVRELRTGEEATLDAEIPVSWGFHWVADGLLTAAAPGAGQRWFRLDPMREIVAPEGLRIERVRGDGLVWLGRTDAETGELELFRWREGEAPQPAWSCTSCRVSPSERERDSIDVIVQTPHPERSELWRLDDAGGPARMLSDSVGPDHLVLDDERVLTVLVDQALREGPLTLSDGADGPAVTLAPRVARSASVLTAQYQVPDEIVYEAVPPDGTHALHRARLAP